MLAYKNDPELKKKYVERAIAHRKADETVQSYNGRDCIIRCLAHSNTNAHGVLENDANLPRELNCLAARIFRSLPRESSNLFAERYVEAPEVGADLSLVASKFLLWILDDEVKKSFDADKFPEVEKCRLAVVNLYKRKIAGERISNEEWEDAARAARAVDVVDALAEAAYTVDTVDAVDAVDALAEAADAVDAVAYTADAVACAANYALAMAMAYTVDAVDAVDALADAVADALAYTNLTVAREAYERMADKLIELLKGA